MKNKIKDIRTEDEITLKYLSYVSGISVSYLYKLEEGHKDNPSAIVMECIAKALNKRVRDVFFV